MVLCERHFNYLLITAVSYCHSIAVKSRSGSSITLKFCLGGCFKHCADDTFLSVCLFKCRNPLVADSLYELHFAQHSNRNDVHINFIQSHFKIQLQFENGSLI